jgi:hypothetical protein
LDEEDREKNETQKKPTPWATTNPQGKNEPSPMLAKGWVDALDQLKDAGEAWRRLAELPPKFVHYMSFMYVLTWSRTQQRAANSAYREPSMVTVPDFLESERMPYAFAMLLRGRSAFVSWHGGTRKPMSLADLPLVTIICLYFMSLVMADDSINGFLRDARDMVCTELDDCLNILPRMVRENAFTDDQAKAFRHEVGFMKCWANVCMEPISLGDIHVYSRAHWTNWHGKIIASNSTLLQIFLYLSEKRRLEAAVDKGATGRGGVGDNDADEDERLLGALLEDKRVAPLLLRDGRPKRVQDCITALQNWCHIPTTDGEAVSLGKMSNRWIEKKQQRQNVVQRSCGVRMTSYLSQEIFEKRHFGLHIDMKARLSQWGFKEFDDSTLMHYLIWEMDIPNCLKLEQALCTALQKSPAWIDMWVHSVLAELRKDGRWRKEISDNCNRGLRAVLKSKHNKDTTFTLGTIKISMLEPAIIMLVLAFPQGNESLKAALASAIQGVVGWQVSWNDELFKETLPGWKMISQVFRIEQLSEEDHVKGMSCIRCWMPPDHLGEGRRPKEKKVIKQHRSRQRNEDIGDMIRNFMNESRPILEQAYGKKASTSSGDIKEPTGQMAQVSCQLR